MEVVGSAPDGLGRETLVATLIGSRNVIGRVIWRSHEAPRKQPCSNFGIVSVSWKSGQRRPSHLAHRLIAFRGFTDL